MSRYAASARAAGVLGESPCDRTDPSECIPEPPMIIPALELVHAPVIGGTTVCGWGLGRFSRGGEGVGGILNLMRLIFLTSFHLRRAWLWITKLNG